MKGFLFTIILALSLSVEAGGYSGKSKILWVGSIVGDHFAISGDWVNKDSCSNMNQNIWKVYSMNGSLDELQSMYSMAMAAYLSGKTIELYTNGCDGGGTNGRPIARSMYLPSRDGS